MNKVFLYRLDWLVILCYLILVLVGVVNIYSSTFNNLNEVFVYDSLAGKHLIIFIISLVFGFFILFIRTQFFQQLSYLIYFVSILLLIGLFFFGETINSATSWYIIKGFSLQPSELAKIGTAFAISRHLSDFNTDIKKFRYLFTGLIIILIPFILIILQPDPGSAIIFGSF